jgi:alcohol dehydrogenase (cytochrome c)
LFLCAQITLADAVPDIYRDKCSPCHGSKLEGGQAPSYGPALRRTAFVARWGSGQTDALAQYIIAKMPANDPGTLSAKQGEDLASFLKRENRIQEHPSIDHGADAPGPSLPPQPFGDDRNEDLLFRAAVTRTNNLGQRLTPVSDRLLAHPPPEDWLVFGHDQSLHRYSGLRQIDRITVGNLALAWSLALTPGTNAIEPIEHDGVLFINSNGTVQAMDAATGDPVWSYARPAATTRVPSSQPRGMAFYGTAIFVPTVDNHVIALDARSGAVLWDHPIGAAGDRIELTAAPLVARGKIIQGVSGCQGHALPGGCYIVALDATNGSEVWRFNTISRPGQPGGDSWNGAPADKRYGGSVWNTGSYDPELNLVYFGTGQTYIVSTLLPSEPIDKTNRDALYTNSTVALDPDTGHLAWFYQHFPGDVWDLDWAFEQTIVSLAGPKGSSKAIVTAGKLSIIDAIDAKTGKYLWSYDLGLQNLVTKIDAVSGRKSFDSRLLPRVGTPSLVCPSTLGGRNWPASAYDESNGLLLFPLVPSCMDYAMREAPSGSDPWREVADFTFTRRVPPGSDGHFGEVAAIELLDRRPAWRNHRRAPQVSALLATAGGIVFEGSSDRYFHALDSSTGQILWQTRLPDLPNAFPITYSVHGKQYVAIVAGGGTPLELFFRGYTPEFAGSSGSKTLVVFALPSLATEK